jgi:thymidylate synthase ThyX
MEAKNPKEPETSKAAYAAAIRAKVLDCLRGLLPASTMTNMGLFANGRFYETLLHKLNCHNLVELQEIGKVAYEELAKVVPSFIRRSEPHHRHHKSYAEFHDAMQSEIRLLANQHEKQVRTTSHAGVQLIAWNKQDVYRVAAALLFGASSHSLQELTEYCKKLPDEELQRILDAASNARENRRQKSPRALEQATFTFEILGDFGAYRDLHRHRILSQERQFLTCDFGYYEPEELEEAGLADEYRAALEMAKDAFQLIHKDLPEEAQYVVPMAYNVRWYFTVNLRALQWLCELRSQAPGHPAYRLIAQQMAKAVSDTLPDFERFFKFVDYEGYHLGRLDQEQKKAVKLGLE